MSMNDAIQEIIGEYHELGWDWDDAYQLAYKEVLGVGRRPRPRPGDPEPTPSDEPLCGGCCDSCTAGEGCETDDCECFCCDY